jgi:hypothetical protein
LHGFVDLWVFEAESDCLCASLDSSRRGSHLSNYEIAIGEECDRSVQQGIQNFVRGLLRVGESKSSELVDHPAGCSNRRRREGAASGVELKGDIDKLPRLRDIDPKRTGINIIGPKSSEPDLNGCGSLQSLDRDSPITQLATDLHPIDLALGLAGGLD